MTAGEVAALIREEKKWSPADQPGTCARCGRLYLTGEHIRLRQRHVPGLDRALLQGAEGADMSLGELPAYQDPNRIGPAVMNVSLDRIRSHPLNVRKDLGDLRELAESIAIEGVLVPLMAERRGDHLRLLHCHRRHAAATLAGLQRVPCVIVDQKSDEDAMVIMLAENIGRRTLTNAELRAAARKLHESYGMSANRIAKRIGVGQPTVSAWLREAEAAGEIKSYRRTNAAPKVAPKQLFRIIEQWRDRIPADLVEQLLGLLNGWEPSDPKPDAIDLDAPAPISVESYAQLVGAEDHESQDSHTEDIHIGNIVSESQEDRAEEEQDPPPPPTEDSLRRRALNLLERCRTPQFIAASLGVSVQQVEQWEADAEERAS